ncbi:DMT family transporter [Anaeromicropila herbilytica]|uniref:Transporter n=1 Tax=Anaeromicropila herbilytica TaxID=2785025 RepID=A0A7R7IDZ5_9FIRM|nr:DMT family transporter [Anaeromicropila herbilytica]BCN31461.1 transporter [Anaeromicropila herbilytica]
MENRKSTLQYSLLLFVTAIIWGGGFIVVKTSLDTVSTLYLLAFRFTIGAIGMSIIFFNKLIKISKSDVICGIILGFLMFIAFTFQIYALNYTTVGKNAFLTAAYVVLVPFFSYLIRKTRLNSSSYLATLICMLGIGLLSLDTSFSINIGDLLTLLCAAFYALHIVFSDIFMNEKHHDPIIMNIMQLGFAACFAWITAPFFETFPTEFNANFITGILYLGIACTMLAFLFQAIGQKNTSPHIAAIILSTESVFGCIFSVLLLNETMTLKMILGCILIFISIILSDIGLDFKKIRLRTILSFKNRK